MAKYATGGAFGSVLKNPEFWKSPLVLMGAPAAAGAGAAMATAAVNKIRETRAKGQAFKEMLELHPHLKTRDPEHVQRIFNSLHNVNPMMAQDPMVSGAWVDTIVESAGSLGDRMSGRALLEAVKDLAGVRAQISRAKKDEPSHGRAVGSAVSKLVETGLGNSKR